MSKVFANGRSILHKGAGNTHVSAAPDVCKVPTPAGPVPTPFINSAQDSMLAKGSKKTTIEGNPVALTSSELSTSSGDEPGTAGGLISSKFKGKMTWGSGSTDVKVEGKGVVRFLDPTLHNGNTFNTSFIAMGSTGLAYGDDTQCTACNKSVDTHRVLETPEVVGHVERVFVELMKRFNAQRPHLDRYLLLREKRSAVERRSVEKAKEAAIPLAPKKSRAGELLTQLKSKDAANKGAITAELGPLQAEIREAEEKIKKQRVEDRQEVLAIEQEMAKANEQLESMKPVLRLDDASKTFLSGYMTGACICKCPQKPKMLAACSGDVAPGFKDAVAATPFELVESFQKSESQARKLAESGREKWECAAPKLLQKGGAAGHKLRAMSERYFSPMRSPETVSVEYSRQDEGDAEPRKVKQAFGHGESVPSCKECQVLTPEMLCDNSKECA
ncbi:PAAR-like domain-containing protein [Myxococcus sp. SDU36]|uniref:DUF4150 domain-containing protein n=1 Tax=Myxococcus sp. SDU36 TaxID=2831967 RepID=UPI002542F8EA|nr:PAAR-like domain-containing protein [Myxococcus sp. SDU36]WIG92989.1 DUF4150 domain-containing protein [Myxococcus sp. SDU36]